MFSKKVIVTGVTKRGKVRSRVVELHIRTVAAILIWFVVALLILNRFLRSGWIWLISIAMTILALLLYFIPRLRK